MSHPKTKARNDKIIRNPDHPTSPDMSQTHILPKMFLVCFSRTPNACDSASHKSSSPSGNGVACFPSLSLLPHTHTHTIWHHARSLASRLTGEGGIQPEQSAHIGSPELPCHTESLTIAPPPATLPPTPACQTQSVRSVDAPSHPAQPCSHTAGGRWALASPLVWWGCYHKPLRALHSPAPSLPVACRGWFGASPPLAGKAGWLLEFSLRLGRGRGSPRTKGPRWGGSVWSGS